MNPLVLLATSTGPTQNLSIFDPASPPAESIRHLSVLVFAITGFIFLVVEGILLYAVVRFRRRGAAGTEPPQVYGSKPIEIAWTAAPALIVVVLILVTARTLWEVTPDPPAPRSGDNTLFVTVVGRQWWWEYRYDRYNGRELGFITANELHVPASDPGEKGVKRPVYLRLESADVCHSFWVPRLAGKVDLIPGRTNTLWFQTDKPGLYLGQCAEYCGTQHAGMLLRVNVDAPADFERWLENQKRKAVEDPAARAGKEVFLSQSCVNCHRIRGTPAKGTYAPDLTHLMSRQTLGSGTLKNDEATLRQWLLDPQKLRPGCLMPAFRLDDRELRLVVQYLRTLE
ncbi:MAG TPA: cytochrome c oxidase subunit II [Gemmataceae bacterium]|nr:cytochrome c oxidase subunit II [Gemmataceae bacterium]